MNLRAPGPRWALPCAALLAALLTHCGGSAQRSEPSSQAAASGGEAAGPTTTASSSSTRRERSTTVTQSEEQAPPSSPRAGATTSTYSGAGGADEGGVPDVAYWQGRLDQALSSLGGAGGECRDVCRATTDICVAAHEICDLTGDGSSASAQDPRCGRARGACEQATRQRNGSCPVCPGEH